MADAALRRHQQKSDYFRRAERYVGDTATLYENRRVGRKWRAENDAAQELIPCAGGAGVALDVPAGTGRLFPLLKSCGFEIIGLDVSPDMLALARARAETSQLDVELRIADIRAIPFSDDHFDLVTCVRFLNLIDAAGVEEALSELRRVTKSKILIGIRYLPSHQELQFSPLPIVRLLMRAIGLPQLHARRSALFYHREDFVRTIFDWEGLDVVETRLVERRFDGTDYVFFLLQKRR